ncbi:hypothetical protein HS088_TW11G01014 [Tripterygium wilfordii]|uniref:Uncharacterized protein n=1 Tax=Tripterygium wilfordii TaxID=458696 RepID=A0A7J7D3M5_TRIWF|nr:uncharacterized protein LOC120008845 [Tripterygium wilfordii]KAF5740932.1 hypothetical protein HS088_TW11G01014 [Tripterygium wilfordii]
MTANASLELRDSVCSLALLYITGTSRFSQHLLTTTIHLQLEISRAKEKMEGSCHVRSNSMPSSSHPLTLSFEEHLNRLKASKEASTSVRHKFRGLKDLYDSIDDLLQLPLTQQTLNQERSNQNVEEVLHGSLRLLDSCDITRDIFSRMREYVKELESSLRRRKGGDSSLANEVRAYMMSKKKLNKVIEVSLRNLKLEKKCTIVNATGPIKTLREVEEISLAVF